LKDTTIKLIKKLQPDLDNASTLTKARDMLESLFCHKIKAIMKIPASSDLDLELLLAMEI
jgi:hypothetical protein